jgi:hypothetical protein
MPTKNINDEWQIQHAESERVFDIAEKKRAKRKKIKWFIKGHLIWHTGKFWNKFQTEKMCIYTDSDLKNRKLISAYEYWKKYSPVNGC